MMRRLLAICFVTVFAAGASSAQQPAKADAAKAPAGGAQTPAKAPAKSSAATATPAKTAKAPAKAPAKAAPALATQKQKLSYALGMNFGLSMKQSAMQVDFDSFVRGLVDQFKGQKTQLSPSQMAEILTQAQQEMQARQQAEQARQEEQQKVLGEKNKREGDAFLAQNKARPGVVTLPSGLQYEIVTPGDGPTPKATDTVTTHYRGTLIDGTEFDSSYKRGQPASFSVGGVIKGWTEALQLMKVGAKWKLYIPASLAYGEQQRGQHITPNSVLIFDIELLAIKEPLAQK
jgi:FKBP-type peptidyl-prolyl cis-trans isomerase